MNDNDLLYLIGGRHATAFRIAVYVRKRAMLEGRLHADVSTWEIMRDLGISDRRQVQRAKAYLRERGFPIIERVGRYKGPNSKSGHLKSRWVVDRRRIRGLVAEDERLEEAAAAVGASDRPGAGLEPAFDSGGKQHPPEEQLQRALQEDVGRAPPRAGPEPACAGSSSPEGAPAPEPSGGLGVAVPAPPREPVGVAPLVDAAALAAALAFFTKPRRGTAHGRGSPAPALREHAVRYLSREHSPPFGIATAMLAVELAARELAAEQLPLGGGP